MYAHLDVSPSELQLFLQVLEEFAAAVANERGGSGGACVHHNATKTNVRDAELLRDGRPDEGPHRVVVRAKVIGRLEKL